MCWYNYPQGAFFHETESSIYIYLSFTESPERGTKLVCSHCKVGQFPRAILAVDPFGISMISRLQFITPEQELQSRASQESKILGFIKIPKI